MIKVLLVNQARIPHYRVPVYSYLSRYLRRYGFDLFVASEGVQRDNPHAVEFQLAQMSLGIKNLTQYIWRQQVEVIISWVDMKHLYLFPMYVVAKGILRRKMIYWGQGRDLLDRNSQLKNLAYASEQALCDAIILYAEHLKKYVPRRFHKKVFVANNTLFMTYPGLQPEARGKVLSEYGIHTKKNIICMGRFQKRKRLENLVAAHAFMNRRDIGLILVGPDPEGILKNIDGENIFNVGPIYGDEKFDLLSAADVYCLPGAVGLSIIDGFHCGLPFVTEEGDESAEIMYLKDGVNGFVVPRGDVVQMAHRLELLLNDETLRAKFSEAGKREIAEHASIDKLCEGFRDALDYVVTR